MAISLKSTRYGDTSGTLQGYSVGGNQVINGSFSDDLLYGDAHTLTQQARGGNDIIYGGRGNDTVFGDAYSMSVWARGGDDYLDGGIGSDYVVGDAMFMSQGSVGGDDTIRGGAGDDYYLFGDAYALTENTRGGNDYVSGDAGSEIVVGTPVRGGGTGGNSARPGQPSGFRLWRPPATKSGSAGPRVPIAGGIIRRPTTRNSNSLGDSIFALNANAMRV